MTLTVQSLEDRMKLAHHTAGASMRILVIGKFNVEGFAQHIVEALQDLGHEVARFEPTPRESVNTMKIVRSWERVKRTFHSMTESFPAARRAYGRRMWALAKNWKPQLTIVCHDFLWPDEVARLKDITGGSIAMWFPDSMANFGRSCFMVAPYDAVFLKDPFPVLRLRNVLEVPVYYLPECFNPKRHRLDRELTAIEREHYGCDITTAGNMHAYRVAYFRHLSDYNLKLWGNPPPAWIHAPYLKACFQGRYIADEEKAVAFRAAKIVLNNLLYAEVWGINARAFEIAGIGGFQMIDWRPGIRQLFEDGKELVTFQDIRDLREKMDHYLTADDERRNIAMAGMERAKREHTYGHRLTLLIRTLEGRATGYSMPAFCEDKEGNTTLRELGR